jgi:hypothetical protein
MADDDILAGEVLDGVRTASVVEDYPSFAKGPAVLVLQEDAAVRPIHVSLGHPQRPHGASCRDNGLSTRSCAMDGRFHEPEGAVMTRETIKLIHEGRYAAEVPVELIDDDTGWSPYLSVANARKLDRVRKALREGDIAAAAVHGRVFELVPVA